MCQQKRRSRQTLTMNKASQYLSFIMLALAFTILLVTIYPYYRLNNPPPKIIKTLSFKPKPSVTPTTDPIPNYSNSQFGLSFKYPTLKLEDSSVYADNSLHLKLNTANNDGIMEISAETLDKPVSVKTYIQIQNENYRLECGHGGCGGGSPFSVIGTIKISGLPGIIASWSSPHELAGPQISYFVVNDATLYQIDTQYQSKNYQKTAAYQSFIDLISTIKLDEK